MQLLNGFVYPPDPQLERDLVDGLILELSSSVVTEYGRAVDYIEVYRILHVATRSL